MSERPDYDPARHGEPEDEAAEAERTGSFTRTRWMTLEEARERFPFDPRHELLYGGSAAAARAEASPLQVVPVWPYIDPETGVAVGIVRQASFGTAQSRERMANLIERALNRPADGEPITQRRSLERGLWVGYGEDGQVVKCSIDSPPFDREQRRRLYLAGQILALGEDGALVALQKENERLRAAAGWSQDDAPSLGGSRADN